MRVLTFSYLLSLFSCSTTATINNWHCRLLNSRNLLQNIVRKMHEMAELGSCQHAAHGHSQQLNVFSITCPSSLSGRVQGGQEGVIRWHCTAAFWNFPCFCFPETTQQPFRLPTILLQSRKKRVSGRWFADMLEEQSILRENTKPN